MGMLEKILLALLLLAFAAFPGAVFLYLRTAYRKGGWPEVKAAAGLAVCTMLIFGVSRIWFDWEFYHFERVLKHPFALSSILFVILMWLAHRALKAQTGETHDYH